jgi:type IV secretory pathway VirB2 component (pilin)
MRRNHLPLSLATVALLLCIASTAYAQAGGLGVIEDRARDIGDIVRAVAGVIVGIGAVMAGIKFVKGDPDSWGYAWKFGLGSVLVYSAPGIVAWLGGN